VAFCPDNSNTSQSLPKIALLLSHLTSLTLLGDYDMSGLGLFYYLTRLKLAVNHDAFDASSLSHLGKLDTLSIDWKNKTLGMGDFEIIHRHMRQL
jgi:hypothetical protein